MKGNEMVYKVSTRDVDGSSVRKFRSLAGAVKRFESMSGLTIDQAIAEQCHATISLGNAPPPIEAFVCLRAVSMFGTVVELSAVA
jgi:hypothetical protein